MKVMFVVSAMNNGGAERVVSMISNSFVEDFNEVYIVMVSENKKESFYKIDKKVLLIPLLENLSHKKSIYKKVKKLREIFNRVKPDVVISFLTHVDIYTHFAIRGLGIPHIVSERNDPNSLPSSRFLKILRNYVYSKSDGIVVQTDGAFSYYRNKAKKICKIENPVSNKIESAIVNSDAARKETVVFVGSNKKEKNRRLAFSSFSEFLKVHPTYTMHVYGDPINESDSSFIKQKEIEKSILYMGKRLDWQELEIEASMFLLTSDFEGFPNALLEAAAIGIPCVSTDCPIGGPKEILGKGKVGLLVDCNDQKSLVSAMCEIVNDNNCIASVGERRNYLIKNFSIREIKNKWYSFISDVING